MDSTARRPAIPNRRANDTGVTLSTYSVVYTRSTGADASEARDFTTAVCPRSSAQARQQFPGVLQRGSARRIVEDAPGWRVPAGLADLSSQAVKTGGVVWRPVLARRAVQPVIHDARPPAGPIRGGYRRRVRSHAPDGVSHEECVCVSSKPARMARFAHRNGAVRVAQHTEEPRSNACIERQG